MNSLIHQSEIATEVGETTEVSWRPTAEMTYDQWSAIGRTLQQLGRSLNWWIGDWLNHGEARWGEMYTQALEITGLAPETLSKYKGVSARVAPEIRHAELSWTHHFAVAYAREDLRGPMLEIAARYDMHSRDLKEIMRLTDEQLEALIEAYNDAEDMSYAAFARTLNEIRLGAPSNSIVNGQSQRISQRRDSDDDDNLEFEQETAAIDPSAYDDSAGREPLYDEDVEFPAHTHDEDGTAMPEPVYLEEVMQYFDEQGTPLRHCLSNEVSWNGLTLRAAVNKQGEAILLWEKNHETRIK